jgi:hypothetical protein
VTRREMKQEQGKKAMAIEPMYLASSGQPRQSITKSHTSGTAPHHHTTQLASVQVLPRQSTDSTRVIAHDHSNLMIS